NIVQVYAFNSGSNGQGGQHLSPGNASMDFQVGQKGLPALRARQWKSDPGTPPLVVEDFAKNVVWKVQGDGRFGGGGDPGRPTRWSELLTRYTKEEPDGYFAHLALQDNTTGFSGPVVVMKGRSAGPTL